ncbi:MAG: type VI secretion system protein TssA [Acidobacteriota bacterium]
MPLRDDLLNPIPGDNPAGVSLRYERIYDQIKEARTEDDETLPTRGWERSVKKADFGLVMKLAGEALATKSKDLQLAAWLTEAHMKREGLSLLQPCIKLLLDLQEQFWDNVYPEIDEGDAGMRAVPLEWIANRLGALLREAAITRDGLSFFDYKAARKVGYETEAKSDNQREAREKAIAEGKLTAEDFDKSFAATPKVFYRNLDNSLKATAETLDAMQLFCEAHYGSEAPGFGKLRDSLEEVGAVIGSLLNEKLKLEPDQVEVLAESEPEPEPVAEAAVPASEPTQAVAAPKAPRSSGTLSAEPTDWDDAVQWVHVCAQFFVKEKISSPIAYLLQSAIRLGEMRHRASRASYDFLVSPPAETRQNLKRLAMEASWDELQKAAIAAAGEPCGRAWLDVHRYVWKAADENGYSALASCVIASVRALLKDVPELLTWTLDDDTPTANAETQKWLEEMVLQKAVESPAEAAAPEPAPAQPVFVPQPEESDGAPPDVLDLARDFIRRGQLSQALQILMRDAAQQPSGRARFQRRLQIAQFCMNAGQGRIAFPVLEELVKEIEERRLEEWEAAEVLSPPLALLLRCLEVGSDNGQREALFSRLCRIDPIAAMNLSE